MKYEKYLSTLPRLDNKVIVVTGANSGIGLQTAKNLAYLGAHVLLACRSEQRARKAISYIRKEVPGARLRFALYDQASYASIDRFARTYESRHIDAFVFNAGICGSDPTQMTEDGNNLILGTNFFGVYHMMELWKDKFRRDHTRVVFVSSLAGTLSKEESIRSFASESANRLYGYSKLCVSVYACKCMNEEGLEAVLVHPGMSGTNIMFGQDSALPGTVVKIGKKLLALFPDKGAKPSLMSVRAVCEPYRKYLYIRPRSIFGILGLPKIVKMPENFIESDILEKR
ncbi:MAG: SDR family NAD(P)-dependent oxidoreductase [Lachnospiraceae bacterium]|nr:SDR family NAD(P)-dependent oxidoreductase [Lachnospiraceae bacterium]